MNTRNDLEYVENLLKIMTQYGVRQLKVADIEVNMDVKPKTSVPTVTQETKMEDLDELLFYSST